MSDPPLSSAVHDTADAFAANEHPFVVIGHAIANDRDEDLRAKAEAAVACLVPLLTGRRAPDAHSSHTDPGPGRRRRPPGADGI